MTRLLHYGGRVANRQEVILHLNSDALVACEMKGVEDSNYQILDQPKMIDSKELIRRGDNLNIFFPSEEGKDRWRPEIKSIGKEIFSLLFSEKKFLENLSKAAANANSSGDLWIRINGSPSALGIPFELLHNDRYYLAQRHIFYRSLTGYELKNKKPFHAFLRGLSDNNETLRVLIVASNSDGEIPRVEDEARIVRNEIETSMKFFGIKLKITFLSTGVNSYDKVSSELKSGNYHIFHYCGHGDFVETLPEKSGIWLLDSDSKPKKLTAASLNLITLNSNLQFVFLSCCLSAGTKEDVGKGDFYGIYEALAQTGIPTIIGYRWTVRDLSAREFSSIFYQELLRSLSPAEALFVSRREVALKFGFDDETWASPVLLMQIQ